MQVVEFSGLRSLPDRLVGLDPDAVVLAMPPGSFVPDLDAAAHAYAELDGTVVLAATATPRVDAALVAAHPTVSTPYAFVAGDALAGPVEALAKLALDAGDAADDADHLTRRFLAGDDLELDIGAELFLVLDGTGTDVIVLGGAPYATATGSAPAVVIGAAVRPADESRDLGRVWGYEDGVADDAPRARVVAPEIVAVPFWDASFCATVVRAAEASGAWAADVDDPVPGLEVPLATISPRLFSHVEAHVGEIVVPALRAVWPEFAWNGLHDAFVIKYVAGAHAALALHHDVAQISASVRLNDGYDGGALEFPRQSWDNRAVPVGDLVAWPSLVTHPHRGNPVTRGVKYALTLWFALPT